MTWTVNLSGHDDLSADAKEEFERGLVEDVQNLVAELTNAEGVNVTSAQVTTNTTGTVDLAGGSTVGAPPATSGAGNAEPGADLVDDDPEQTEGKDA